MSLYIAFSKSKIISLDLKPNYLSYKIFIIIFYIKNDKPMFFFY